MKKILFALTGLVLMACSQTPEQKAEELAQKEIKKSLYKPDTYQAVETKLDSAFAPYDTKELYTEMSELVKLLNDYSEIEKKANDAQYEMEMWSDPFISSVSKAEYNRAKAEFDKYSSQLEQFKEKIKISWLAVDSLTKAEKQFVGFKVFHNYRADNNAGNTLIGNHVLFVDPNIENVFFSMDMEEYNGFQESIKQFLEQAESLNLESE